MYYYLPKFCGWTGFSGAALALVSNTVAVTQLLLCLQCFFIHRSGLSPGTVGAGQAPVSTRVAKVTFLTAWWSQSSESLYMLAGFPWINTLRNPCSSCKAFYNLDLEVPEGHFHSILLVKQVTKAIAQIQILVFCDSFSENSKIPRRLIWRLDRVVWKRAGRQVGGCLMVAFVVHLKLPTHVLHPHHHQRNGGWGIWHPWFDWSPWPIHHPRVFLLGLCLQAESERAFHTWKHYCHGRIQRVYGGV